ncbi:MAG: cobalt ECF transporter T component CbiQ [Actinomycetota bacterium]
MLTLDVLANTGPLRNRPAVEKVIPAVALVLVTIVRPVLPTAPVVLALTTAAAVFLGGIPVSRWLRALSLPAGFIVAGTLGIVLVGGDGPGPIPLTTTQASRTEAATVLVRSIAGTSAVVLIGVTTPMVQLIALLRTVRIPAAVTDLMGSMYRLTFDLINTGRQLRISQASRLGHVGFRQSVQSSGMIAAAVFVRSVHRARRLQIGLDARAYDGELRVLSPAQPADPRRLAGGITAVVCVLVLSYLWPATTIAVP